MKLTERLPHLLLRLDTIGAGTPEEAVRDACIAAARMGVWVKVDINGIEVLAAPNDNGDNLWRNYCKASERRATFVSGNVIPAGRAALLRGGKTE